MCVSFILLLFFQKKLNDIKSNTINQIRNIIQEKNIKDEIKQEIKDSEKILISSFDQLLKICADKKEIKLKY